MSKKLNIKCKILPYDLTIDSNLNKIKELLDLEKPNIKYLFNVSGFGKFGDFKELDLKIWDDMIDLNIKSLVDLTYYSLQYMSSDSHILNISSMSAFSPLPYLSVYAASKSFVLSFTLALNKELKKKKIHAHALCPLWTNTNFINVAKEKDDKTINNFGKIYEKEYVIRYMWKKMKKNKDLIIPGKYARFLARAMKFMPKSFVRNRWLKGNRIK